jgi:hypothetical protein
MLVDYRSALRAHLLPVFGQQPIESITTEEIEAWRRSLTGLSNRSKNKRLIQLHGSVGIAGGAPRWGPSRSTRPYGTAP